jgi:microcystin-dependent protein
VSDAYCGEIRMFGGNFAPVDWAKCDGQLLAIAENEALFQLIGTTFGGDGQSTFGLPDLRGRVPISQGAGPGLPNYVMGELGGVETVTLTINQMAAHTHALQASRGVGNSNAAQNNVTSASQSTTIYYEDAPSPTANLNFATIQPNGGGGAHENMQPFLAVTFIISLYGIYPPPF